MYTKSKGATTKAKGDFRRTYRENDNRTPFAESASAEMPYFLNQQPD